MATLDLSPQQKGFFNLVRQSIENGSIIHQDTGGIQLRGEALRYLRKEAKAKIGWASISPFNLTVEIEDRSDGAALARFFSGEGFIEEEEKWNGTILTFTLDLVPGVKVT